MIIIRNKDERKLVSALRDFASLEDYAKKHKEILELEKKIQDLEVSKSRIVEDNEKRERELRHMIGLERKRQEFEIESAKRQTTLDVREENLKADQKRFAEQLAFNTERFEKAADDSKQILAEIIKRLPNVNMEVKRR